MIMDSLSIVSWNIKSIKRVHELARDYLVGHDLICLQETWLHEFENDVLQKKFPEYRVFGKSSMNSDTYCKGRPYGGIAIMWKNSYNDYVECIETSFHNIQIVKIRTLQTVQ